MADIKYLIEVDEKGAVTKIKEVDQALDGLKGKSDKAGPAFSGMWKQFVGGQLVLDGLKKGFGALKGFITSSIDEAKQAEVAEHNLATALDLTGRSRDAMLPGLIDFSQEIQDTTKFTQEDAQASLTLLTQLTNLDSKGLKTATKGAVGLASVMGIDLNSATMLVTKAMGGNYTALGRLGIKIDETLPKEQQRTQLLEKLSVFYGRATAETDTFAGRITQLSKAWDDVKEAVGKAITENETIKRIIGEITEKLTNLIKSGAIEEWATKALDTIMKLVDGIKLAKDVIEGLHEGLIGMTSAFAGAASGATAEINEKIGAAKTKVLEFRASLQILKPPLEEMRKESEKGADSWAKYTDRIKGLDDMAVKNKAVVEAWSSVYLSFFGGLPPKVNETGNALGGAADKAKTLAEQLGLTTKLDLEKKLALMQKGLIVYKDALPLDQQKKFREEIDKTIASLHNVDPVTVTAGDRWNSLGNMVKLAGEKINKVFDDMLKGVPKIDRLNVELVNIGDTSVDYMARKFGVSANTIIQHILQIQLAILSVLNPAFASIPVSMDQISRGAAKVTTETKNYFDGLYNDIAAGWGSTVQTWLSGATTFKDFWKGIWGDIKDSFFRVIGEMAAEWTIGLVKNLIKGATDVATTVAGTMTSSVANMGSALQGLVNGVASILPALAKGIALAAETLAAAAPAILKVGAIAIALYAGFKVVEGLMSKIFGGGGKSGDVTYWLKLIWENTQNIWNTMTWLPNTFDTMNQQLQTLKDIGWSLKPALTTRLDKANVYLREISEGIAGLPSAQTGAYVARDALVKVHRGEVIGPAQNIYNSFHTAPAGGSSKSMSNSFTFNIYAIDNDGMEMTVRKKIMPMLTNIIHNNTNQLGGKFRKELLGAS